MGSCSSAPSGRASHSGPRSWRTARVERGQHRRSRPRSSRAPTVGVEQAADGRVVADAGPQPSDETARTKFIPAERARCWPRKRFAIGAPRERVLRQVDDAVVELRPRVVLAAARSSRGCCSRKWNGKRQHARRRAGIEIQRRGLAERGQQRVAGERARASGPRTSWSARTAPGPRRRRARARSWSGRRGCSAGSCSRGRRPA